MSIISLTCNFVSAYIYFVDSYLLLVSFTLVLKGVSVSIFYIGKRFFFCIGAAKSILYSSYLGINVSFSQTFTQNIIVKNYLTISFLRPQGLGAVEPLSPQSYMAKPKLKPTTAAPIAKPKVFLCIIFLKQPFLKH